MSIAMIYGLYPQLVHFGSNPQQQNAITPGMIPKQQPIRHNTYVNVERLFSISPFPQTEHMPAGRACAGADMTIAKKGVVVS